MLAQADVPGPPAELGAARDVEDSHPVPPIAGNNGNASVVTLRLASPNQTGDRAMPLLIGSATLAATLLSMAFGQINVGFEAFGVLLGAVVLMTLREE